MHGDLYDLAVKVFRIQESRLAQQYRDLNALIRVLSGVGMMLVPGSMLLRPVRPRSAAYRFLEGASERTRAALDIILNLQLTMADHAPTDAERDRAAASLREWPPFTTNYDKLLERVTDTTKELAAQSARPQNEHHPTNIVEVKIRLPESLRQQLAGEASRNKRTITAAIRARLELSCGAEILKKVMGQEMAEIVAAAAENRVVASAMADGVNEGQALSRNRCVRNGTSRSESA